MIKLFLIISLLFFNIIQVWTFAINLEENDNSNLKSINETNRFDQYWTYENLDAIGNESIIYFKPLNNSSNYYEYSETVCSFDLVKVCDCTEIFKDDKRIKFNYVFSFQDFKCFDNRIMKKYHQYQHLYNIHGLFSTKFSNHLSDGQKIINGFLILLKIISTSPSITEDERKYFKNVYEMVYLYKNLSSSEKLILKKDEPTTFNDVMYSLFKGQLPLKNCAFQQNIEAWIFNINRSGFRIDILDNEFCFVRTFAVPADCDDRINMVESLKAFVFQFSRDGSTPLRDIIGNVKSISCKYGLSLFYDKFPDFKGSQTCKTHRNG